MLPGFDAAGHLPPGIHFCLWDEFVQRFGTTPHRKRLIEGLAAALRSLQHAGCRAAYVDGSFVTNKEVPGDFDGCWDPVGVNDALLDPVLLDFSNKRANQKAKFGGELFPSDDPADAKGTLFIEFFQSARSGVPKGIVAFDLRTVKI